MKIVADLHIHSKYARATSKNMDLENLDKWAQVKGINVLGTGDFTHPAWMKEIKEKLEPAEPGLFCFQAGKNPLISGKKTKTRFLLTSEISSIYSKNGKVRRVHNIILVPSVMVAEKISKKLSNIGNLKSDGRPILGLDAEDLAKIVFDVSEDAVLIPAHVWTPWFSVFGSKSGFDSLAECFGDYAKYIFAIETGLSSDPAMNWRLSMLDNISLVSNSDSHSPAKIGREVNFLEAEMEYQSIISAIKGNNPRSFPMTIEFFPEEGKYHWDGHRNCGIAFSPKESKQNKNICPVCHKPLTIGVLSRVAELADRAPGYQPKNRPGFQRIIPLMEVIAESIGSTILSRKVLIEYEKLIQNIGDEFTILLSTSYEVLARVSLPRIAEGIIKVREGKVFIEPGSDGIYGKIKIF